MHVRKNTIQFFALVFLPQTLHDYPDDVDIGLDAKRATSCIAINTA